MEMEGKVVDGTERGYSEGSYKYEDVIFDAYKYDTDNEIDDGITSYPALQMESRRIFYSKFFNLMKSCYRY
jgi:hypothetical protein